MSNNNNLDAYGGKDICCTDTSKLLPSKENGGVPRLSLRHVLGFNGTILNGLHVHPTGKHLVYALGRHVIIEDIIGNCAGRQEMLSGHTGTISTVSVSMDGRFIVTGQVNQIRDTRSPVILWDWCARQKVLERELHKATTAVVAFTASSRYFVSLGGPDDTEICVWDTVEKKPLKTHLAQIGRVWPASVLSTSKVDESMFVTAGERYGRIWKFDNIAIKLSFVELVFGLANRKVISCEVGDQDHRTPTRIFCGTSTGSILCFHGDTGVLMTEILNPMFPQGPTVLTYVRMVNADTYAFLVGTGEGKVAQYTIKFEQKGNKSSAKMAIVPGTTPWIDPQGSSSVMSISKLGAGQQFYVGLYQSHMHRFTLKPWGCKLVRTCSNVPVNDAAFARGTDDLLITAEHQKVRVFNLKVMLEVRRFVRNNRECFSVCMRHDGTHIFTGWDCGDVLVLGFEPTGLGLYIVYKIETAHRLQVSCMALTSVSDRLITGSKDGFVSVWRLVDDMDQRGRRLRQGIRVFHFVDQKGPITRLRISADNETCVVSSLDGTVIGYNLISGLVIQKFTWPCGLTSVSFCHGDLQMVSASSDGRIQWGDMVSGDIVRDLSGSSYGAVKFVDTEPVNGQIMASAGDDRLVKIWNVERGEVTHVGEGHSDDVTLVRFGPCGTVLLSAAKDGSVCLWDVCPEQ